MLPYNPYANSKGLFNPRVMVMRSGAPPVPAQQASTPQAGVPQVSHPRRSKVAHIRPEPLRGPSGEKHRVDTEPDDASILSHPPVRKKSRLEEHETVNKAVGVVGITNVFKPKMNIQNAPPWVLTKVLQWQVKGESTAVTIREIANLVLVSKEFCVFFHPELVKEGIRHAARTKNHQLLRELCPKAQTLNFPAPDLKDRRARNVSLPPIGAPLHESAGANDPVGVSILLDSGAAPNFLDCRHETALHRAAKSASSLVFGQLMRKGGNPQLRNLHLWTPFDIAIASTNLGVIYSLWRLGQCVDGHKDPTGSTPVHKAIDTDCLSTLGLVLSFTPKLSVKDWSGATPLIYAIREGKSPDAIEMIMGLNPNPLVKDRAGKTALFYMHVRKDEAVRELFARFYCGPTFNKGLKDAQKKCYRRYETIFPAPDMFSSLLSIYNYPYSCHYECPSVD